jgi:hypothetical protein
MSTLLYCLITQELSKSTDSSHIIDLLEQAAEKKEISKKDVSRAVDRLVEEISSKIMKNTDKIEIPDYGILSKSKIKKILTDDKEAKKFLKAIGFNDKDIEKPKELAERVLKGELTVKDGFKLLMEDTRRMIKALKSKEKDDEKTVIYRLRASSEVMILILTVLIEFYISRIL